MMSIDIEAVKRAMGLPEIKQCEIFENALLHPSYIYETNLPRQVQDLKEKEYRRLAHLGDAVIGAIVTDYLYSSYPNLNQGNLTEVKQCLVDKTQLAKLADKLNLHQFCKLGKSQQRQTPETQVKLFAEMFEAVFGALYLEFDRDFSRSGHWLVERIREDAA
jgi:dsRNA-specific ribonuclease